MSSDLTNQEIQDVLTAHKLGELASLEQLTSGSINPTYLINNKYVLRLKDDLEKEILLFNLLSRFSIPTPKVIATTKNYLIMSCLPGQNLKDCFASQSSETKKQLSAELGTLANKIHSITLNDQQLFGDIKTWVEKSKNNFQKYWQVIKTESYFDPTEVEKVFEDYQQINNIEGRFVHGDFSPGNIMVNNGHIVGIIDFEFSGIGDPLSDLEKLPISFQIGPDFDKKLFLKNYGHEKFSDQELTRLKFYSLNQGLWEIWATKTQAFPYGKKEIDEGKQLVMLSLSL